ncbi:MAG: hypothetical protein JWR05_2352 [Mucilaginibacter sp.]|nr:hypothetical protein [Mucilaginibacter sp.]
MAMVVGGWWKVKSLVKILLLITVCQNIYI